MNKIKITVVKEHDEELCLTMSRDSTVTDMLENFLTILKWLGYVVESLDYEVRPSKVEGWKDG